jgi:hypothetical protein
MRTPFKWALIIFTIIISTVIFMKLIDGFNNNAGGDNKYIGSWTIQRDQSSAQFTIYKLEFVDSHTLICNISNKGQKSYNIQYQYSFVGSNRIKITAPRRLTSEWEIIYEGEKLVINSSAWPGGIGVFNRSININWPLIALLVGICLVGTFFIPTNKKRGWKPSIGEMDQNNIVQFSKKIKYNLSALVLFLSGIITGFLLWSFPPLRQVRLPWDSVITLELSLILFIFGIRTIIANHRAFMALIIRWNYLLGMFLIGVGVLGIIIGGGRLYFYFVMGFYI